VTTLLRGERLGPFLVFTDQDGLRHAVRLTAVLALSDTDPAQDSTLVQLAGQRSVVVAVSLEEALGWLQADLGRP
jgi:hypothetical protein